jgi:hypothetical protein
MTAFNFPWKGGGGGVGAGVGLRVVNTNSTPNSAVLTKHNHEQLDALTF